jgi:hypothetical protein
VCWAKEGGENIYKEKELALVYHLTRKAEKKNPKKTEGKKLLLHRPFSFLF